MPNVSLQNEWVRRYYQLREATQRWCLTRMKLRTLSKRRRRRQNRNELTARLLAVAQLRFSRVVREESIDDVQNTEVDRTGTRGVDLERTNQRGTGARTAGTD